YGEFLLRRQRGETPLVVEYQYRFPQYADWLAKQIALHQALSSCAGGEASSTAEPTSVGGETASPRPVLPQLPGYSVLKELGRGGMGVVYLARQTGLNRLVALKILLAGEHTSADGRQRFRREAEAVARLQHPGIVQIYEIGERAGRPFLALEYV